MRKFLPIIFPMLFSLVFFWQFLFKGLLPIPADTIVGLYHPFRDLYAKDYPRGIPFKNFLITDPVRQQYPWRNLSIELLKKAQIPLWNPYNFSGYPLLANFQSAVFYPLNFIFFILPFSIAWSLLIALAVFLSLFFMFLYLDSLKLNKRASILGAMVFSFSGFSIAWLEWGTIIHTILWLPLILLATDKLFIKNKKWLFILAFSLVCSFLAGHLQIFSYVFGLFFAYSILRWLENGKEKNKFNIFILCILIFALVTSIQWIPTLQFINESARSIDQSNWQKLGWFVPWQNLLQFVVPDFFGNPATLNYWGVFNYGEFVGYVGIAPLIMSLFALFFRKEKIIFFFGTIFFLALIFSLPTFFAKLPFIFNIPLISTAQPTRLIFIVDFSLAVLSAFGLDLLLKSSKDRKKIIYPLLFLAVIFIGIWLFTSFGKNFVMSDNLQIAKHNLIPPTILFLIFSLLILVSIIDKNKFRYSLVVYIILALSAFDLFRFGWKFIPFTKKDYLFPKTSALSFLQKDKNQFRIMNADPRIFPPNFSSMYHIQSIDGYDPLYLKTYGQLIAASERGQPNILPPFGFDRIITPHNFDSKIIDLLGVKYVLSLSDLTSDKLTKVFSEDQTKIYENKNAFPRVFFVEETISANRENAIKLIFDKNLNKVAIVEDFKNSIFVKGEVRIIDYRENKIVLRTENKGDGFLVLTDSFYPTWHAKVDSSETKIIRTDFNFRGILIPKGNHKVEFYVSLF